MKTLNIKGYKIQDCHNHNLMDHGNNCLHITKDNRDIAYLSLREGSEYCSVYVIDAGGSIIYDQKPKNKKRLGLLAFLNKVVNDIESYYERRGCFI